MVHIINEAIFQAGAVKFGAVGAHSLAQITDFAIIKICFLLILYVKTVFSLNIVQLWTIWCCNMKQSPWCNIERGGVRVGGGGSSTIPFDVI